MELLEIWNKKILLNVLTCELDLVVLSYQATGQGLKQQIGRY